MTYFGPALDQPRGGCGRKTTILVKDLKYIIHSKVHQNPSSGSGEEVENVNCLTGDGRWKDKREERQHCIISDTIQNPRSK